MIELLTGTVELTGRVTTVAELSGRGRAVEVFGRVLVIQKLLIIWDDTSVGVVRYDVFNR